MIRNKQYWLTQLEMRTNENPEEMTYLARAQWATMLMIACERLADISRRRAKDLESAYWQRAEEAIFDRRPRIGLRMRSRAPLDTDEVRRARINAGTMLARDPRFKDACSANEMYNRWAMQYAAIVTASRGMIDA